MFICTASDMHPYECNHDETCEHCQRAVTKDHDPSVCALCDPEYDFSPNPYWKGEKEYDCEYCNDTGEVDEDEVDESGNVARGTLTRKCICRMQEDDGNDYDQDR